MFVHLSFQDFQKLPPSEALPTMGALMVVESLGAPVPSEVVLPTAGWWAHHAHVGSPLVALCLAFVACTAGSLIGCLLAYAVGFYGGQPFVRRWGKYLLISPSHLDRAERWLEGKGAWGLAVSRLVVGVRALVSYPVGAARMGLVRFVTFTFIGISVFDAALIYIGYRFGDSVTPKLHRWGTEIGIAVVVLVVGLIAWTIWNGRRHPPASSQAL